MRLSILPLLILLVTAASVAAANTPPDAPLWVEPNDGDIVSAYDPHWNTENMVDPDPGDYHLSSDFEVWDDSLGVRIWSAIDTDVLVHIHLGDGVLEGPLAGESRLDFDRPYRVRARFRDSSGEPNDLSPWSVWVDFRTAPQWLPLPMLVEDFQDTIPVWRTESLSPVTLSDGGGVPSVLRLDAGGVEIFRVVGTASGNTHVDQPPLPDHEALRAVLLAGNSGQTLDASRLEIEEPDFGVRDIYLPAVNLAAGDSALVWVDETGNTYWASPGDTVPDFSSPAQQTFVPWQTTKPEFTVERVASNLHLPVNLAFPENPGPNPQDPFLYVTELYGKVKVMTRDRSIYTFADSVLNFNPTGVFPGGGEMGVTGICVEPVTGDLFVSAVYDSLGIKYNRVLRLHASADGLSEVGRTTVLDGILAFASHQIQMVSLGPDSLLYVQVGDGFGHGAVAQNELDLRGKILRMNQDGSPVGDSPFGPTSLLWAKGLRNPFGGAWRTADQTLYTTDNGTDWGDRVLKIVPGEQYGFCCDFNRGAIHVFPFRVGPTALDFDNQGVLGSSRAGRLYVAWSGPTYAQGQPYNGKKIWEAALDGSGEVIWEGEFLHYTGLGRATTLGLAFGPDGLYFTDLYGDDGFDGQGITQANIYRVHGTGVVGTEPGEDPLPSRRLLGMPYPNPATGPVNLRFRLETAGLVRAAVYDATGRRVRVLAEDLFPAGEHVLRWNGLRENGQRAAAGVYWIQVRTAGEGQEAVRVVLTR